MAMHSADSVLSEKEEIFSLVQQKQKIEGNLIAAGGSEFGILLGMCEDLSDIIGDMEEIRLKMHGKEHAAFMAKVKFSRKMQRKAKDLHVFEGELVRQFELKHVSLEYGRKLGGIVKLLKSNDVEKAREKSGEFCRRQEMGEDLRIINEALLKKKARVERAKRDVGGKLSDLEWLKKEPVPDLEKTGRHNERHRLMGMLGKIRREQIEALKAMPLPELLEKSRNDGLDGFGLPQISGGESESLASFLRKSGLETKTAAQLLEISGQGEQKLRHLFSDFDLFRKEIMERKKFLESIAALSSSGFLAADSVDSPALAYLSREYAEAKDAAARLAVLEKTAGGDAEEWERARKIEQKKAGLAGMENAALLESMRKLEELEKMLEGDTQPEPEGNGQPEPKNGSRKKEGIVEGILGFFR